VYDDLMTTDRIACNYDRLQEVARQAQPRLAFILGSGLGDLAARLLHVHELPFLRVPGLETATTVPGHRGSILLGEWARRPVLVCAGRLHFYEGHAWRKVVQPIHVVRDLGAEILVTTNAAGGIRADLVPGTLLVLRDHVDCTQPAWWRRPAAPSPYAPTLQAALHEAAHQRGIPLPAGVYAQLTGPCYETPAEIRALRACGVDAVGMSTAREIQAGLELGMSCAAISCITNRAAGLSDGPICHEEVLAATAGMQQRLADLLETFLPLA